MITFNFKSSVSFTILGFILGCCIALLLTGGCNNVSQKQQLVKVKELKKAAESKEIAYQQKISVLENRNHQLSGELAVTKRQLEAVKHSTRQKASVIKKMIEPKGYPAKDLLKKIAPSPADMDSSLTPCDSLVQEISDYLQESELKDSLYEAQLGTQEAIIAAKDSVIAFKTELHTDLTRLFDQSLEEQKKLVDVNRSLQRQHKKQRLRGRLVGLATAILSGVGVNYLIQH